MNIHKPILSACILLACSCANSSADYTTNATATDTSATAPHPTKDTSAAITKWVADDYPVTDSMLTAPASDHASESRKKSGSTYSMDKVWFSNRTLGQTIVFELYTDQHRLVTYHFYTQTPPAGVINRMELHTKDGDTATAQQKQTDFAGFLTQATPISEKYFTTSKGIQLGISKEKAIALYGTTYKQTTSHGYEVLEWNYIGDAVYDEKLHKGQPVAADSFGHQVTMFFKDGKLAAQILHNDIP